MSPSAKTLSILKERLANFEMFINAHEKMITKYIIPIADKSIAASNQYIANVEVVSSQPLFIEIKEAGMRLAVKGKANHLRELFRDQMERLKEFETNFLVATGLSDMTDSEATEHVEKVQSAVGRTCREYFQDVFKVLHEDVDAEKAYELEEQQLILQSYLIDTETSDEGVVGLLIRWSEREAAASESGS